MVSAARSLATGLSLLLLMAVWAVPTQAQDRGDLLPRTSPNATVSQTIGVTEVSVTYGRPQVKGRTIFGDLVSYDQVWRTGANEATTITFSTPVNIQGQSLDAGTYGLFTIPGQDTWTVIFNNTANQWGAYNYDDAEDALRVEATPEMSGMTEMLTFTFRDVTNTSATLVMEWAEVALPIDLSVNTESVIVRKANEAVDGTDDWRVPLQYAAYALQQDIDPEQALTWVNASIEMNETFANLNVKARLQAAAGNTDAAVETAEQALAMAKSMDDTPRGMQDLQETVEGWKSE